MRAYWRHNLHIVHNNIVEYCNLQYCRARNYRFAIECLPLQSLFAFPFQLADIIHNYLSLSLSLSLSFSFVNVAELARTNWRVYRELTRGRNPRVPLMQFICLGVYVPEGRESKNIRGVDLPHQIRETTATANLTARVFFFTLRVNLVTRPNACVLKNRFVKIDRANI